MLHPAWSCAVLDSRAVVGPSGTFVLRAVWDAGLPAEEARLYAATTIDAMEAAWVGYVLLAPEFGWTFNVTVVIPDPDQMTEDFRGHIELGAFAVARGYSLPGDCVITLNLP